MAAKRILYVHRGAAAEPHAFARRLEAEGCTVETIALPYGLPLRGVPHMLRLPLDLASYDLIVAAEYALVWALALRLRGRRGPKLVALGFNQSARLFLTGLAPIDRLLDRVWRRVDRFIVHSRDEARLFERRHAIPSAKFAFTHWGFDLPARDPAGWTPRFPRFVSMIGRNNRDIPAFCAAVRQAGTAGVLVTSAYMVDPGFAVPDDVELLVDIPMARCLDIVAASDAHLVLVRDGDRGAGHISAVAAMLLARPQIFSAVPTLDDYLIDGVNGIAVPLHDPEATAAAIMRLRDDPVLAARLGEHGRALATEWMSDEATSRRIAALILETLDGRPVDLPDWSSGSHGRR